MELVFFLFCNIILGLAFGYFAGDPRQTGLQYKIRQYTLAHTGWFIVLVVITSAFIAIDHPINVNLYNALSLVSFLMVVLGCVVLALVSIIPALLDHIRHR